MPAFKYEWQQRVFVPGMKQVQGSIVEVRCHAFRGNSYLVAWHEVSSAGIEIKEQVFTEADIERIAGDMARPSSVLAQYRLCYLATPYTKYHLGIEAAFVHAAEISALLLTTGVRVYSPIAHTHPLAVYGKLDPLDHNIWLPFDEAMMDAADCLIVARMKGWDESYGVKHEIEFFAKERKPIIHIDPVTLQIVPWSAPLQKEAV